MHQPCAKGLVISGKFSPSQSPCHESALTPGPNDVCWFMTALDVGSRDSSAKRNIWLVSDWSSECKHSYLQRGWRVEPCPRAKQGVNQPDSTETPSEIYFHFWPIFSRELIFCCHTSSNSCQDSKFSHFYACSEKESGILIAATPVLGVSPWASCSLDIPWPWRASPSCTKDSWHPCHCHTGAVKQKETPPAAGLKQGICCWWIPSSHWATPQQAAQGGCKINLVCNTQPYMMQRWCLGNYLPGRSTEPIYILRQAVIKLGIAKLKLAGTKGKKHVPTASISSQIPTFCITAQQQTILSSNQKSLKLYIFTPTVSQNGRWFTHHSKETGWSD